MSMDERWLPLPGFEGFVEISDHGSLRSLDRISEVSESARTKAYTRRHKGKILKPARHPRGYLYISLNGGRRQLLNAKVHRLVLETFVGPCPPGMETCHDNDVPDDNRLENLRWDTPRSNGADRVKNGGNRRTHCKNGHELTPENSYILANGRWRRCRLCTLESQRQKYHEERDQA